MSVIILTTGQPGAGKSYSRVRWLVTDFLINSSGLYITNLPLNCESIANDVSEKTGKDYCEILERLIIIPDEELKMWRDLANLDKNELKKIKDDSGFRPADFFNSYDLSGAHIALDEFHRYFSKNDPIQLRKIWNDWFSEIRKLGCTFEAITQDISQLPREFFGKVGVKIDLAPFGNTRDPFFKIKMSDWYQLRGGLTGYIESRVEEIESIKDLSGTGSVSWKETKYQTFKLEDIYFKYYNSFQKSDNSEQKQNFSCPASEYGWRIIFWFFKRNSFSLFSRFVLAGVVIWLCFGGGILSLIDGFMSTSKTVQLSNTNVKILPDNDKSFEMKQIEKRLLKPDSILQHSVTFTHIVVDLTGYQPIFFLDSQVTLINGETIHENYKFKDGDFKGQSVKSIDFDSRTFTTDSYVLRMFKRHK